jgi:hypothetical protein
MIFKSQLLVVSKKAAKRNYKKKLVILFVLVQGASHILLQ